MATKVEIEDVLKHLRGCEMEGADATLKSMAGALGVSPARASAVVSRLLERGLAESNGDAWRLTEAGRTYANEVVRAHRLYETYLANVTGNPSERWHTLAEAKEHELTEEEVLRMDRLLGKPRFDPHGDPIPTALGEMPWDRGAPLSDLPVGEWAVIDHLEDEPESIYADLVRLGLAPQMRLRVVEAGQSEFEIEAEGRTIRLSRLHVANIHVVGASEADAAIMAKRLSDLPIGETASIHGLSRNCRGAERRRLLDLGIVAGNVITPERESPFNGPRAYRICGTTIALRREQADKVFINRIQLEDISNEQ